MKKIAFITDLHYGVRQNSEQFLVMQDKFIYNEFIKHIVDNGIKYVIIGGDIFDCRASVNIKVLNHVYNLFKTLDELNDVKTYVIIGNHDSYLTSSIEYNSIRFIENFKNICLVDNDFVLKFDANTDVLLVPWIIDNEKFITKYTGCNIKTCVGHFAIRGFPMSGGHINEDGIPLEFFTNNFGHTVSGHFHVDKTMGNVIYPNNPFQFTRSDMGDYGKGFSILTFGDDGNLSNVEKIKSVDIIRFEKLIYPEEFTEQKIKGNLVDIYIDYGKNFVEDEFKKYKEKINLFCPLNSPEIKIINSDVVDLNNDINIENIGSSKGLMVEYISKQEIENKSDVEIEMLKLYEESKGVE